MRSHLSIKSTLPISGGGVYELLQNTVGKITGEQGLTLPGSHYCGPLNSISEDYQRRNPPTNRVDNACRLHDIAYEDAIKVKDDKALYNKKIKEADEKMVDDIAKIPNKTLGESVLGGIAGTAIRAKLGLDSITGRGVKSYPLLMRWN